MGNEFGTKLPDCINIENENIRYMYLTQEKDGKYKQETINFYSVIVKQKHTISYIIRHFYIFSPISFNICFGCSKEPSD